jgi:hypothetical protein
VDEQDRQFNRGIIMNDPTPVFPNIQMRTHMPFFDGRTMMFCGSEAPVSIQVANHGALLKRLTRDPGLAQRMSGLSAVSHVSYRQWKLYYAAWDDRRPHRVSTGLPASAIECSPAFYHEGGRAHVSFIGGIPGDRGIVYHLYGMEGASFDHLSPAAPIIHQATPVGFAARGYLCYMQAGTLQVVDAGGARRQITVPLAPVRRATFRADAPQTILITGTAADGSRKTLMFDLESNKMQEVRSNVPVYKSSIAGQQMVVSRASGDGIEPYELVVTGYTLTRA